MAGIKLLCCGEYFWRRTATGPKMAKYLNNIAILIATTLMLPATAQAQSTWGDWYVAPSIVYNDDDPKRQIDDSVSGLQIAVGRDFGSRYSLEGLLGYSKIDGWYRPIPTQPWVRDHETHLDLGANLLVHYNRDAEFSPYALVGLGYLGIDFNINGGSENRPTGSLGVGALWRPMSDRLALRAEIRSRLAWEDNYNFTDFVGTIGVQYAFGRGPSISDPQRGDQPADTDGDGVLDMWDECPNTPPGVDVTSRGCEIRDMDRDTDGDRVPDYRDTCPNTPLGAAVDDRGCSLDSDNDGVPTAVDRCPASRPGADVDEFGCENDSDGDGVLNQYDRCPDTRRGRNVRVDIYGCEISDVISLPGVNFTTGSDLLMAGSEQLLKDAAATLNKYPNLIVEVAGHTDNVGNEDSNLGLSDRRAKTVLDYLVLYGVDPERLTFRGYGETAPIADNSTAEGRATNRRVELRISTAEQ